MKLYSHLSCKIQKKVSLVNSYFNESLFYLIILDLLFQVNPAVVLRSHKTLIHNQELKHCFKSDFTHHLTMIIVQ